VGDGIPLAKVSTLLSRVVTASLFLSAFSTYFSPHVLRDARNWRGRAQEITLLKEKVKELKEQLALAQFSSPSASAADGDVPRTEADRRAMRQMSAAMSDLGDVDPSGAAPSATQSATSSRPRDYDSEHRQQIEEMRMKRLSKKEEEQASIAELQAELQATKQRIESTKARNKILESNQQAMNEKFQTIVQKTKHDDEFIQALQAQNQVLKRKLGSILSSGGGTGTTASVSSSGAPDPKETILLQERQIARQEQIIRSLRAELDALSTQMMEAAES
jgi:hypothetical protein